MKYEYISAYQIFGLTHDPDKGDIEVFKSDDGLISAVFTPDLRSHSYNADRGRAVGLFMLRGFTGQNKVVDFLSALEKEIQAIQEQREKNVGTSEVLVIHIIGEVDVVLSGPMRTESDFSVAFDLIDKEDIKAKYRNTISAIMSAVSLSTNPPSDVRRLLSDVYLKDDSGNCLYSISFSMSAEAYTSSRVSDEITALIAAHARSLLRLEPLSRVTRLLLQTSDKQNDRLRSFLSGWSALEMFLNKTFLFYEQEFIRRSLIDNAPSGIERYIDRIKDAIQRGKYPLLDKFIMIAACLGGATIEADIEIFRNLKDTRDDFFHKQEIVENNLPVAELRTLLARYLRAHIELHASSE
jgi:hypothetical protein